MDAFKDGSAQAAGRMTHGSSCRIDLHLACPGDRTPPSSQEIAAQGSVLEALFRRLPARPEMAGGKSSRILAIIFYNDHGLNFFLDNIADLPVGAAPGLPSMRTRAGGFPSLGSFPGDPGIGHGTSSRSLVADEFDVYYVSGNARWTTLFSLPMAAAPGLIQ